MSQQILIDALRKQREGALDYAAELETHVHSLKAVLNKAEKAAEGAFSALSHHLPEDELKRVSSSVPGFKEWLDSQEKKPKDSDPSQA
ncbi:hypothetical protein [Fulvimarina endophytica]|nr:hypothetical protein [Fulvimarina endophytica]